MMKFKRLGWKWLDELVYYTVEGAASERVVWVHGWPRTTLTALRSPAIQRRGIRLAYERYHCAKVETRHCKENASPCAWAKMARQSIVCLPRTADKAGVWLTPSSATTISVWSSHPSPARSATDRQCCSSLYFFFWGRKETSENKAHNNTQSPVTNLHAGHPWAPHSLRGGQEPCRGGTRRWSELRHNHALHSSDESARRGSPLSRWEACSWPCQKQSIAKTELFRWRTWRRFLRPSVPSHGHLRAPDNVSLSVFLPDPTQRRSQWHIVGVQSRSERERAHESGVDGQLRSSEERQSVNDNFEPARVEVVDGWRSKSRTNTFVRTQPPASRQIRAVAFSSGKPLLPRTPATAHADRWWPRLSRRRPHRPGCAVKGRGIRRRCRSRILKGWESILKTRSTGKLTKGVEARCPPWDRRSACCGLGSASLMACRRRDSTARAARDCHPFLGWLGSTSPSWSSTSSAAPEAMSSREEGRNQRPGHWRHWRGWLGCCQLRFHCSSHAKLSEQLPGGVSWSFSCCLPNWPSWPHCGGPIHLLGYDLLRPVLLRPSPT